MTRRRAWPWVLLVALLAASTSARAVEEPPAALIFGDPAPQAALAAAPAAVARSGGWTLRLLRAEQFAPPTPGAPAPVRLLLRGQAPAGQPLAGLQLVTPPLALAADGSAVEISGWRLWAEETSGATWVALYLPHPPARLSVLALDLGQPTPREEQRRTVPLEPLGEPRALPELDLVWEATLARVDDVALETNPADWPPFSFGQEPADAPATGPWLSVRLHTLGAPPTATEWALTGLEAAGPSGTPLTAWRLLRLPWRPDWGGWLGARGDDAPPSADTPAGVLLSAINPDSPAAAAGLQVGDRILKAAGQPTPDAYTLGELVRQHAPGTELILDLQRDGTPRQLRATLGGQPQWPGRDEVEWVDLWQRLGAHSSTPPAADAQLLAWDWQCTQPVTTSWLPRELTLVFTRQAAPAGTTLLFRDLRLGAAP